VLRHQLIVLKRRLHGRVRLTDQDRGFLIQLYRWFASILAGSCNRPARDAGAVAQGRFSPLLALEVAPSGRAATNRSGAVRVDPADEPRKSAMGAPRIHGELLKLGFYGQAARAAQPGMARFLV